MGLDYRLARLCVFLGARLPLHVSYSVAQGMASALYALSPRLRDDAESSAAYMLGQAKGSRGVSEAARRSMRNYAKDVVDLCRYSGRPAESKARVSFDGLDRLDAALREGKGVILVGLHLGSWDVGAAYLAQCNYPMNAVVLASHGNDGLERFMHTLRSEAGVGVISAQDGIWHAAEALRRNEVLALLIDGPAEGKSVPVEFLGGCVRFSAGPAALALRTKAVVLPACTVRLPDNTFKGLIGGKVEPGTSGDFHSIIQTFTQRMLESLQGYVRQYPDQWGMLRSIVRE